MSARTRFLAGPIRGRTHRSAPTRWERYSEIREIGVKRTLPQRGGTEPAPYRRMEADQRRGAPRGRRGAPRVWLPPAKFRNGIWGVSHRHRPLRPAGGREGGTPYLGHGLRRPNFVPEFGASVRSSCPTGGCGEPPRLPGVVAHSGAFAATGARDGWESLQRSPPKCLSTPDNPSVMAFGHASSLYTREPFPAGDGG